MEKKIGTLYICGTPIGNLGDITLRCLEILKKVDLIAAEDTRHTKILLDHYHIKKSLTSYYEFSKQKKTEYLLTLLKTGQDVALLSDAGMPGICDPGYEIINKAIESNVSIVPIPGVSALTTALIVSGFAMQSFVFEGFVPRKRGEREKLFSKLKEEYRTIILYETPHRIKDTLLIIKQIMGERRIVIARELTKVFEEIIRGTLTEVIESLNRREIKGEITLVLEGQLSSKKASTPCLDDFATDNMELAKKIKNYLQKGYYHKDIVALITKGYPISKKSVYEKILELKKEINFSKK